MSQESALQFPTNSRIHIGLAVLDLTASILFYRALFGQEPSKVRPGYAKFEVFEPPVNLSLNQIAGETAPVNPVMHYGIQVKSTNAVNDIANRMSAVEIPVRAEENVTCCYAVQTKVWIADPDGNKWEAYVVLDNDAARSSDESNCCLDLGEGSHCCQQSYSSQAQMTKARDQSMCCYLPGQL